MSKILVVEDYPDLADLIEKRLKRDHESVETVANGKEALELLRKYYYDLIILDWHLPEVHGIDILRRFRSEGGKTPVLMLTARKNIAAKEEGFDAGADDYLTKPFHPKELSSRVKALLRRAPDIGQHYFAGGAEELLGRTVADKYEIKELLGEGNMGIVYKARHKLLDRMVALKVIKPSHASDARTLARFSQEARAAGALNHPNIIGVHDYGIESGKLPFIVMDLLHGRSLADWLDEEQYLSPRDAIPIFTQICDALIHSHERGVLHRDLKPSNIFMVDGGGNQKQVKLIDFGIAKIMDQDQQVDLTRTEEICGSPLYLSPEQIQKKNLDQRSDIYSLGLVFYRTLTGKPAFVGKGLYETVTKRLTESPATFCEARPDLILPMRLESIVFKMLERERENRYQSVAELKSDLFRL